MKATGIVRRIDDLGRVVVPKEIRRTLRIREGDPLEIFTDKEGEIILKKYSPIGELSAFARQYAESLSHMLGCLAGICDMDQVIERVAICPGSGKSMIGTAIQKKAQVMITGDIGHHDGIDAVDRGIAVIDAGHYGLEHIFISRMEQYLKSQFPNLEIKKTESGNPFQVM